MKLITSLSAALSAALLLAPAATYGTNAGADQVRDIGAHLPEVSVLDATAVGEDLAFLGSRGDQRVALHWIEGDSGEQRKLAQVRMGDFSHELEALGDIVVFTGRSPREDVEPWRSDGTKAGTRMLRDIAKGRVPSLCTGSGCPTLPAGSFPTDLATLGDVAYFTAADRKHGRELWRTDGTRSGTRLVRDIHRGKGTGLVGAPVAIDGRLWFAADDGRHGSELWHSDGTRSGTRMLTDIGPGWSVQWWDSPVAAGAFIYFGARTAEVGLELWRTDGTAEGTKLVKDIRPGPKPSKPEDLVAVGDLLYFTANDGTHGRELWRTDGTAAGTTLVKDITPGKKRSLLGDFAVLGTDLYFAVWDGRGELMVPGTQYRSDGTASGTQPFGPAQGGAAGMRRYRTEYPSTVSAGGLLYFPADDGIHGTEPWSTDGTPEGTKLVHDVRPGPKGSDPQWLVATEGYLYLTANDGEHGRQWWQLPTSDS